MNLLRRTASLPGLRAVLLRPGVRRRLASLLALRFLVAALRTNAPLSVVVGEVFRRGETRYYRMRGSGQVVAVVHGRDLEALYEVFWRRDYEPPAVLEHRTGPDRIRCVLDLGANVGMFTAWARGRWPEAEVVSVEPSPLNLDTLRRVVAGDEQVELITAAVGDHDGQVEFVDGLGAGSHVGAGYDETGGQPVDLVDFAPLFARADLVKMDIEGGEWPILRDPRLAGGGPLVLVMEYHRVGAPYLPALEAARDLLEAAGFQVGHEQTNFWGHGTLWAWRG